jgi:DNA polymerase III delta prime subunit
MLDLWSEKYRPLALNEYVWRDPNMRQMVEGWIRQGATPHVLFSGHQGTGKTSLCLLLLRLLNIPSEDVLKINASRDRRIEELQDKIVRFIDAWALNDSGIKYILLDEADKLSPYAQGLLRGELEAYAHCTRFMMTCNYPNKIIPALHSRLQEIKFLALNEDDFLLRAADVLVREEVNFEAEVLMLYKERTYPDLRKCIGLLQQNTRDGNLLPPQDDDEATKDYLLEVINLFKRARYLEGRKLILAQADPEEYEDLYRFFYQHLELFGATQDQQDEALLAIRRALVHHATVADREINLAALLVELSRIATPI